MRSAISITVGSQRRAIEADREYFTNYSTAKILAKSVSSVLCAQLSLQVLAGESPAMVTPESHVAYTQYRK